MSRFSLIWNNPKSLGASRKKPGQRTSVRQRRIVLAVEEFEPRLVPSVTAVPANDFLDSLGINTHIDQGYSEAQYEPMFQYTGIRNTRDGGRNIASDVRLHQNTGVLVDVLGGGPGVLASANTLASAGALLAIEGPNEPNNFPIVYNGQKGGGSAPPPGLRVNTSTGVISGTPTTAGTYAVALVAGNSHGQGTATLTITVNANATIPRITSALSVAATGGSAFTYQMSATWSPTGYNATNLPPGLSVNTSTGLISGTPTLAGTSSIPLSATNAHGTGTAYLTLTVNAAGTIPLLTSALSVTATVGSAFTYQITATQSPTSYNAFASWVPVANAQQDLYSQVQASPTLQNYPVFNVSEDGAETNNVGLQYLTIPTPAPAGVLLTAGTRYADYANPHDYLDKGAIIDNLAWRASDPLLGTSGHSGPWDGLYSEYGVTWLKHFSGYSAAQLPTLPRVTTETGFETGTGGIAVSQDQQGKLYLNTYLDFYKQGWQYTFIYEMVDNQGGTAATGIYVGSTPKISATDIHNLTTILADTTSNTPGSLNYSIPSEPATVHDMLMQKSDGTFYLVVWDERVVGTGSDNVTLNLGGTYSSVNVYDPTVDTTVQQQLNNVSSVALSLSDHPLILAIGAPATGASASFVNADSSTQGNWIGVYGTDGYNVSQDANVQIPSYAQVSFSGQGDYTWAASTSDPRALQKPENPSDSIAGTWFAPGSFTIDVNLTDGNTHQAALYALDWDSSARAETIRVRDATTGAVLDTESLAAGSFSNGVYLVWNVSGHVQFEVDLDSGVNAVISGLFFDPPAMYSPRGGNSHASDRTRQQRDRVVQEGIAVQSATGLSAGQVSALEQVPFVLGALPPGMLGDPIDKVITIDPNADSSSCWLSNGRVPPNKVDLLTVAAHELGLPDIATQLGSVGPGGWDEWQQTPALIDVAHQQREPDSRYP